MATMVEGDLRYSENLMGRFIMSWSLKSFSHITSNVNKCFVSQVFYFGDNEDMSARIFLYPSGNPANVGDYVSALARFSFQYEAAVSFTMAFQNTEGKHIYKSGFRFHYDPLRSDRDWLRLMGSKNMFGNLPDDTLVMHVEGVYSMSTSSVNDSVSQIAKPSPYARLLDDMAILSADDATKDVVIDVEGTEVRAHSALLAARSTVFADLFGRDAACSSRRVFITDFSRAAINAMVRFVYCSSIESLDVELARDLLRAAKKFDLDDLRVYCSNFLMCQIHNRDIGTPIRVNSVFYDVQALKRTENRHAFGTRWFPLMNTRH